MKVRVRLRVKGLYSYALTLSRVLHRVHVELPHVLVQLLDHGVHLRHAAHQSTRALFEGVRHFGLEEGLGLGLL